MYYISQYTDRQNTLYLSYIYRVKNFNNYFETFLHTVQVSTFNTSPRQNLFRAQKTNF